MWQVEVWMRRGWVPVKGGRFLSQEEAAMRSVQLQASFLKGKKLRVELVPVGWE